MSARSGSGSPAARPASLPDRTARARSLPGRQALAGAVALPLLVWVVLVPVSGLRLLVDTGAGVRTVGPVAVVVTGAVAASGAVALGWLLRRSSGHPRRHFLILTVLATALSLVGPTGAAQSTAAVLGLVALHLSVAVVAVPTVAVRLPQ